MKLHKYIFLLLDDKLEIYKDGKLEKYNSEKQYNLKGNYEEFWRAWKGNSAYIEDEDKVNFLYISKKLEDIKKFETNIPSYIKKYENGDDFKNPLFEFSDIKEVLDLLEEKEIGLKLNEDKEVSIIKNKTVYELDSYNKKYVLYHIVGDKVKENFLSLNYRERKKVKKEKKQEEYNARDDYFLNIYKKEKEKRNK